MELILSFDQELDIQDYFRKPNLHACTSILCSSCENILGHSMTELV